MKNKTGLELLTICLCLMIFVILIVLYLVGTIDFVLKLWGIPSEVFTVKVGFFAGILVLFPLIVIWLFLIPITKFLFKQVEETYQDYIKNKFRRGNENGFWCIRG